MNRVYGMSVNVYATHLYVEVCLVYGLHAVIYSSFKKINVIDRIRYITYMLEPYTHDNFHFRWVPLFRLSTLLFSQPSCNYTMNHMEMIYFSCYLHNSTIFPEKIPHQTCNTVCRQYVFVCKLLKYTSIYGLSCIFLTQNASHKRYRYVDNNDDCNSLYTFSFFRICEKKEKNVR